MRSIKKEVSCPPSLEQNCDSWTEELIESIKACGSFEKVPDALKNRYKKDDVLECLKDLYSTKCCYCESPVGVTCYENIEHRKPKSIFCDQTFRWENLHLCCQVCNTAKGNKWNSDSEIVDPRADEVSQHLEFIFHLIKAKSDRGLTTIDHAKLNRKELQNARLKIATETMSLIEAANKEKSRLERDYFRNKILGLYDEESEYFAMVENLINEYLRD